MERVGASPQMEKKGPPRSVLWGPHHRDEAAIPVDTNQVSTGWCQPWLHDPLHSQREFCHLQTEQKSCTGPSHLISLYLSVLIFKKWDSWQQFHKAASQATRQHWAQGRPMGVVGHVSQQYDGISPKYGPQKTDGELGTICSLKCYASSFYEKQIQTKCPILWKFIFYMILYPKVDSQMDSH